MEKVFMSAVDNTAAQALQYLAKGLDASEMPERARMAWARFLYSLILRTPEHLEWARLKLKEMQVEIVDAERELYLSKRTERDPPTFEEFRQAYLSNPDNQAPTRFLHRFISNGPATNHIMRMRWSIASFKKTKHLLLTSDRPLVMTNGFSKIDGHLAIPISPTQLFLAANNEQIEKHIHGMPQDELIKVMNLRIVEQARKFVYGRDDQQHRFVSNRFGAMKPSTPLG
jgi:hypothetical protein